MPWFKVEKSKLRPFERIWKDDFDKKLSDKDNANLEEIKELIQKSMEKQFPVIYDEKS